MPSVAILTCDKEPYRTALPIMRALLDRWWPDRPWPVEVWVGGDHWGASVARHCYPHRDEWVLLLEDDYWAQDQAWNTDELARLLAVGMHHHAGYVRVQPTPGPSEPLDLVDARVGVHRHGDPYRTSLQAGWWRADYLASLAIDHATPWEFEMREPGDPGVLHLSVTREAPWPVSYGESLKRGEWLGDARRTCEEAGLAWPGPR